MNSKIKRSVDKNLEKMLGKSEMNKFLTNESIGGNAGRFNGKCCAAANFYYTWETGEIKEFTNDVKDCDNCGIFRGTFRLITTMEDPQTIVDYIIDDRSSIFTKAVIGLTVHRYNVAIQRNYP